MRLIDADNLYKSFEKAYSEPNFSLVASAWWFFDKLRDAPTVDVSLVTHGRWIEGTVRGEFALICSECRRDTGVDYDFDYCPNCGAKMDLNDNN